MPYSRDPNIPGFQHHASIPYKPDATRLQTLDIWLPERRDSATRPPAAPTPGLWLIYVHGGAWRDPTQDSLCAVPTLRTLAHTHRALLQNRTIAGIASLNYRLSPYPHHPTAPSAPDDADRTVAHPTHAQDVRDALTHIVQTYTVDRWLGIGHSCGATLLLQLPLVSAPSAVRDTLQGLVLLAGIYDVPAFLSAHSAPACPRAIADVYAAIVAGAFGAEAGRYAEVSPTTGVPAGGLWGRYVVLGYSLEDGLVEPEQRELMLGRYLREGWVRSDQGGGGRDTDKVVDVRDLKLGHDEVWEEGGQIADLIAEVVGKVVAR